MENTDISIQKEEPTTVVESVTEDTLKVNGAQPTTEETSSSESTEVTSVEKKEDDAMPVTKSINEQENVTDTGASVLPPTCVSPARVNVPLKEMNESGKEESTMVTNGTENGMSKKRELEQEDEQPEETTNDNDDRSTDQIKKIKTTESVDTPVIESKESEKNIVVNGNTAVEV